MVHLWATVRVQVLQRLVGLYKKNLSGDGGYSTRGKFGDTFNLANLAILKKSPNLMFANLNVLSISRVEQIAGDPNRQI